MKRKIALALTLVMALSFASLIVPAVPVYAASGSCGENVTWSLSGGTLTISGTGEMENYSGDHYAPWYNDRSEIQSVIIEDGVTSIGACAFSQCTYLANITISDNLTSIGESAFKQCTNLTSIRIPDSVISIGAGTFYECTSLTSISIPNSVTSIGVSAFWGCTGLVYNTYNNAYYLGNSGNPYLVLINSSNEDIADWSCIIHEDTRVIAGSAFANWEHLTDVTIPNGVISIGDSAFISCSNLRNITIPDSVTSIGSAAFANCESLNCVDIPNGVTSIGGSTFNNCTSLTSVTIPDSVTEIGTAAFQSCASLTNITIPDSVTSIGSAAFGHCTSLAYNVYDNAKYLGNGENPYLALISYSDYDITSCIIHKDTKIIASGAFERSNIAQIQVESDNSYLCNDDYGVVFNMDRTKLIAVPCKISGDYEIPSSVISIGDRAFSWCTSLTSITIPESVIRIGDSAFNVCSSLNLVRYKGTEEQWNAISIGDDNNNLINATRQYNYGNSGNSGNGGNSGNEGVSGSKGDTDSKGGSTVVIIVIIAVVVIAGAVCVVVWKKKIAPNKEKKPTAPVVAPTAPAADEPWFCGECGARHAQRPDFCGECGAKQ